MTTNTNKNDINIALDDTIQIKASLQSGNATSILKQSFRINMATCK